jgi:hypothetical protein
VFLLLFGKECAIEDVLGMLDRICLLQRQTFVETCDRCRGFGRCLALGRRRMCGLVSAATRSRINVRIAMVD